MYREYRDFKPPAPDTVLWRYLDFTKFVSLLDRSALFFAQADTLGDPFEGSLSKATELRYASQYLDQCRNKEKELQKFRQTLQNLKQFVGVSCWHANDYESDAMWKLYGAETGVAIKTNCQAMKDSITDKADVLIGQVNYIDYDKPVGAPDASLKNLLTLYLHKRKHFEHEREVRALTHDIPPENGTLDLSDPVWDGGGKYCTVDFNKLVEEVVVSPLAAPWFVELIQSVSCKYGLDVPVRKSSMVDLPV